MFPLSYSGDVREAKRNAVFPSFLCTLFLGKRFFFVGVVVVFFTLLSPLHSRNQCVFGCHGWNHIISTPTHGPPYPLLRSPKTRCRNGLLYIHTHTLNRETSTAHSCLVTRLRRAAAGTPITARLVRLSRTCKKKKSWQNCSFPLARPVCDYVHMAGLAYASYIFNPWSWTPRHGVTQT